MTLSAQLNLDGVCPALRSFRARFPLAPRTDLDQCSATTDTVLRRLEIVAKLAPGTSDHVVLLGDDDLLSVALCASGLSAQLTVVDADERLLAALSASGSCPGARLIYADLRDGLPVDVMSSAKIVVTDPPYTLAGQMLFMCRAMEALSRHLGGSLLLSASSLYLNDQDVEQITGLAEAGGLALQTRQRDFNRYVAPMDVRLDLAELVPQRDITHFYSDMFHFTRVRDSAPPMPPATRNIYDYEGENGAA